MAIIVAFLNTLFVRIVNQGTVVLRIYYGKVSAFLSPKEDAAAEADESDS